MTAIELEICEAIDRHASADPDLMVSEVMSALNSIYKDLDKLLRKYGDTAHIVRLKQRTSQR